MIKSKLYLISYNKPYVGRVFKLGSYSSIRRLTKVKVEGKYCSEHITMYEVFPL